MCSVDRFDITIDFAVQITLSLLLLMSFIYLFFLFLMVNILFKLVTAEQTKLINHDVKSLKLTQEGQYILKMVKK